MKALFILSSPHGGSTLLSHLIGRHPDAANLGEITMIPKYLRLGELCTCGCRVSECSAWARVFAVILDRTGVALKQNPYAFSLGDHIKVKGEGGIIDEAHQTRLRHFVAKARGALDTAQLLSIPSAKILKASTLPSIRKATSNTLVLYESACEAWGKSLVVDASKALKKAPHIYLERPEAIRILHLVRDGRSVCASRSRYMKIARAAERWNHYHRLARRFLDRWVLPEHRRFLRYEDLVADPAGQVASLCAWLDIEFSPQMLEFNSETRSHGAGGNEARFRFDQGIQPADERWRDMFGEMEIDEFNRFAGRLNKEFGYE